MIPKIVDESWHKHIGHLWESNAMMNIKNNILPSAPFCPANPKHIFRVFETPINDIRVVILGQDPYPNPEDACGLAFAVPEGRKIPYSLGVIVDLLALTVSHDITLGLHESSPFDSSLKGWKEQGVFLLNKSLTCEQGKSNSHRKYWSGFTDKVIDCIASQSNDVVWLLWGNDAKSVIPIIDKYEKNFVFAHSHPAAVRYGLPFADCDHFRLANETLADINKPKINWV